MENLLDLTTPQHAYFFGFVQGDGHLAVDIRNPAKGKLTIELSARDQDLPYKFQALFPKSSVSFRHRDTNFKQDFDAVVWRMCQQDLRWELEDLGVPTGKKSDIVRPPVYPHSVVDYWRGFVDADGSLGITAKGLPYVALVTSSEPMARAYEAFLATITGKLKHTGRNRRDEVFNILIMREDAVKVATTLYYEGCLCLDRKLAKSHEVRAWVRPANMRIMSQEPWTSKQDAILLSMKPIQASKTLKRTLSSIKNRKERLRRWKKLKDSDQSAEGSA